ncbi:MAG: hypothetical protein GX951_04690 [Mollicutes bacterium]|nr:hypothetical protein [Mollicutes bacterium]
MLKTKIIQNYKPTSKSLQLFKNIKDLEITNGYTLLIEKTNIVQVFPIIYKTSNLTIYEFPKEYTKKTYYVVEYNKSYKYDDIVKLI